MKKIILSSLSSAVLVFGDGSTTAFVDDLGPTDPATLPIIEPTDSSEPTNLTEPVDPAEPPAVPTDPTEPSKPAEPTTPSESEKPIEPTTPIDFEAPVGPTESSEPTEPSQPAESTTPSEPEKPVTPEQPRESIQPMIPEKPAESEIPKTSEQSTKPIDVVVIPNGEIDKTNQSAGTQSSIPIETSNLAEVTHIPSETTPIITEAGEETAAVDKGALLTRTSEGLKSINSSYRILLSGNVEVKTSNGKMEVLPHTGGKFTLPFSVLGSFFVLISGFFFFKKNKRKA